MMKATKISGLSIPVRLVKIMLPILSIAFLLSCKDDDQPLLGTSMLQGKWVEKEPEDLIQFAGTNHTFVFREDSFFIKIESWTDVVDPGDPCEGCPGYVYAKGEYAFDLTTINFEGKIGLDSNFAEPGDRGRVLTYNLTYNYKLKSSSILVLNPESEYESITLVKE